jgi:hypothetical protein
MRRIITAFLCAFFHSLAKEKKNHDRAMNRNGSCKLKSLVGGTICHFFIVGT